MLLSQLQIPTSASRSTSSPATRRPPPTSPGIRRPHAAPRTEDGSTIPESGAILLYLTEGTPFCRTTASSGRMSTPGCSSSRTCSSPTSAWGASAPDGTRRRKAGGVRAPSRGRRRRAGSARTRPRRAGLPRWRRLHRCRLRPLRLHPGCPRGGVRDRGLSGGGRLARAGRGDPRRDRRPRALPAVAHAGAGGRSAHDLRAG